MYIINNPRFASISFIHNKLIFIELYINQLYYQTIEHLKHKFNY